MIFLITILANIWVHWIMNPFKLWAIRKYPQTPATMKPFDCESCMSFWATLVYYLIYDQLWYAALMSGLAYFLGSLESRIFVRYLNKIYARTLKRFF